VWWCRGSKPGPEPHGRGSNPGASQNSIRPEEKWVKDPRERKKNVYKKYLAPPSNRLLMAGVMSAAVDSGLSLMFTL